jgi:hypothetical protein
VEDVQAVRREEDGRLGEAEDGALELRRRVRKEREEKRTNEEIRVTVETIRNQTANMQRIASPEV